MFWLNKLNLSKYRLKNEEQYCIRHIAYEVPHLKVALDISIY